MPYKVLVADDDEGLRRSHEFALQESGNLLNDKVEIVETANSVETRQKLLNEVFDLIIIDNDFKDDNVKGHLPGIALLQLARREGKNRGTPMVFCSADPYDGLKPMAEKFQALYLPKAGFDIEKVGQIFADLIKKKS